MEILSSRVLLRPRDPDRSVAFYRDTLELAIYREFPGGVVFFLGSGFLEVSGHADGESSANVELWFQVRDLAATARQLAERNVPVLREPRVEPWGLKEMWISDPDGLRIVLVEVPEDHPIRRDQRE